LKGAPGESEPTVEGVGFTVPISARDFEAVFMAAPQTDQETVLVTQRLDIAKL
jgi:hypothetical protein